MKISWAGKIPPNSNLISVFSWASTTFLDQNSKCLQQKISPNFQIFKYLIVFPLQALVDFRSCQVPDFASDPVAVLTSPRPHPHPGIEEGLVTNSILITIKDRCKKVCYLQTHKSWFA